MKSKPHKKTKITKKKYSESEKNRLYKITTGLYHYLYSDEKVKLKKIHNVMLEGYYDEGDEGIVVDYRKSLLSTLIHEFIHKIHVDWTEKRVRRYESKIVNQLSQKQIKKILRALSDNI